MDVRKITFVCRKLLLRYILERVKNKLIWEMLATIRFRIFLPPKLEMYKLKLT
jgi:hypothetical protein